MRKRVLAICGIAVLVIGAAIFATAQAGLRFNHFQGGQGRGERRHGPGSPEMIEHMARALGLTEDQKTQIKAVLDGVQATEDARHQKMEELHKQMEAVTANGQFDEAKVREIANQQAQIHADQIVEHERMKSKLFSLLTPEQRVKAEEMHKYGPGEGRPRHGGPPREGGPEKN
ncbi:MAG TPA: Spy/CpxP family protein refolding chaperone [Pyrinomonadaceae bacterium]|nr:Spy/CpxP family protein refolding chaperone [Pyrinomonadaceae bacterium]